MNISANGTHPDFMFTTFNQDCGCFVVGTQSGLRIYNSDPLRRKDSLYPEHTTESTPQANADDANKSIKGKVILAEMLFRCNYVAFVVAEKPKRVSIWDDVKRKSVIDLDFESEVKAVRLRRDRIVVVLPKCVKIFTFTSTPNELHCFTSCPNPRGLCTLSPSSSNSLLAFPAMETGRIQIVDLVDAEAQPRTLQAHETSLACITLNIQGTRLATASEKGTLIRLFSTETLELLTELRRGSQPASIYSINFSQDSNLLCVSSSHGTIHIFSLDEKSKRNKQATFFPQSKLLPKYFSSEWSFSRIEVPGGSPCICAFGSNSNTIIVICTDGSYHKFIYENEQYTKDVYQMIFEV